MNKFLIVLLLALVSCNNDELLFQQFQKFMNKYHKKYSSINEFLARFEVFKRNVMNTFKENNSYQTGITKFSDLTYQEFAKIYLNLNYDAMAMANFNPHIVNILMLLLMLLIGEIKEQLVLLAIKEPLGLLQFLQLSIICNHYIILKKVILLLYLNKC